MKHPLSISPLSISFLAIASFFWTPVTTEASTARLNQVIRKQKKQIRTLKRQSLTLRRQNSALALALANERAKDDPLLEMVEVGDKDNGKDANSGNLGSVPYDFHIGKFEVTVAEYTEFLNAVAATDTYHLYNPNMDPGFSGVAIIQSGEEGAYTYSITGSGNRPVFFVSWFDAARFCNWLHNGKPSGAQDLSTTEDGAYFLNGAESGVAVVRNFGARYALPTSDEWHKAAYYDPRSEADGGPPGDDNYWNYATQSDTLPDSSIISATETNGAFWNNLVFQDVGSFAASPGAFGTYDMTGSLFEWTEGVSGMSRLAEGAGWDTVIAQDLLPFFNAPTNPDGEFNSFGFRVVSPKPRD